MQPEMHSTYTALINPQLKKSENGIYGMKFMVDINVIGLVTARCLQCCIYRMWQINQYVNFRFHSV